MMAPKDLTTLWRAALDRWSRAIELAEPLATKPKDTSIAFIDLETRQTRVNFQKLEDMGVSDHLPCVLAHEVGHHIRYPHTIAEARRMLRFLREVARDVLVDTGGGTGAPGTHDWLLNLFFDLLINDELSSDFEASFVAIYRAMQGEWGLAFSFYCGTFEELWALPRCTILTAAQDEALAAIDPEWRGRAASLGEFMRGHPENRPLQLVRFLIAIRPFVQDDRKKQRDAGGAFEEKPLGGGPLDGDAIADLMRRRHDEGEARRWLREQQSRATGGVPGKPGDGTGGTGGNPLERASLALEGLAKPTDVALAAYRSEADKATLDIPASFEPGEPFVPGPHTSWELGDDLDTVDWIGSTVRSGSRPIPGLSTYARTYLPDDPRPGDREAPWIELYIDSSGSMPNPTSSWSHQIAAGFVLVRAATKAGGRVRIIQYSSFTQRVVMGDFTRASLPAERALLEYVGGGTDFPWDELIASTQKYRHRARVRRVVISDSDFVANFGNPTPQGTDAAKVIADAAAAGGFTGILALYGDAPAAMIAAGMDVVTVKDWSSATQAARVLADTLFKVKQKTRRALGAR